MMRWLDRIAAIGAAVFAVASALTWFRMRPCPIFDDCGLWSAHRGYQILGWPLLIVAGLTLLAFLIRDAAGRRAVLGAGLVVAWYLAIGQVMGFDIAIFREIEGPYPAAFVALGALTASIIALFASAWQSVPRADASSNGDSDA